MACAFEKLDELTRDALPLQEKRVTPGAAALDALVGDVLDELDAAPRRPNPARTKALLREVTPGCRWR